MEAFIIGTNPDFEKTGKLFQCGTINLDDVGALVVRLNGDVRKEDIVNSLEILENLSGHMDCEFIGKTNFIAAFYKSSKFMVKDNTLVFGSMIILKATEYGIEFLTGDDFDAAKAEMEIRRGTLVDRGKEYPFFKLN